MHREGERALIGEGRVPIHAKQKTKKREDARPSKTRPLGLGDYGVGLMRRPTEALLTGTWGCVSIHLSAYSSTYLSTYLFLSIYL